MQHLLISCVKICFFFRFFILNNTLQQDAKFVLTTIRLGDSDTNFDIDCGLSAHTGRLGVGIGNELADPTEKSRLSILTLDLLTVDLLPRSMHSQH